MTEGSLIYLIILSKSPPSETYGFFPALTSPNSTFPPEMPLERIFVSVIRPLYFLVLRQLTDCTFLYILLLVLIQHPRHDLAVGVDVGGGDILIGADELGKSPA